MLRCGDQGDARGKISGPWRRVGGYALALLIGLAVVPAYAQNGKEPLIQPGQIVGGATKQMREVQPVPGFLPQVSLLRPGGPGEAALVYRNPRTNFAHYTKVILDPVTIWTARGSQLTQVPHNQRVAVANTFYADLYAALKSRCRMVHAPSAGTMRLRIALTDATIPDAKLNTVATYTPYLSTAFTVAAVAFNKGVAYFAGTAAAEGYATDAKTGALLWQAVDRRGGTSALVKNTLDNWTDINNAFKAWSKALAARLQELGACRR